MSQPEACNKCHREVTAEARNAGEIPTSGCSKGPGELFPHGESPWGTFLKISQSLPKIKRMKTRKDALHWSCTSWDNPSFPRQQIPRHPFLTHYKFLSIPVVVTWELSVPTPSPPGHQCSHPQGYIQPRNSFSAGTEGLGKYLSAFPSSGK